jgi:transcriptional regulator with XRE-family HTH domain
LPRVSLRTERARELLAAAGLTQADLAQACDVDVRTVQRWLAGGRLEAEDADRVARALEVGTAELCESGNSAERPGTFARIRAMHRALVSRDGAVAQLLRVIPRLYPHIIDGVVFAAHPERGYVYAFEKPGEKARGFVVARITPRTPRARVRVLERILPALLVERARIRVDEADVWLVEHFEPRSAATQPHSAGWFDLWFWVGSPTHEVLLVSDVELSLQMIDAPPRTSLDLATEETAHAVFVRPGVSQLREAELPRGHDRVLNRHLARVDVPVPDDV